MSRLRVSNDNPYSESCFKTVKYQPDYPGRFQDASHARRWFTEFFEWYANNRHRHSRLALFTPADVFFGRVSRLAEVRQLALDAAYAAHPERFVRGRPVVRLPPSRVTINPLDPGAPKQTAAELLSAATSLLAVTNPVPPPPPTVVLPAILHTGAVVHAACS